MVLPVDVQSGEDIVKEFVTSSSSVTVPSGELWLVNAFAGNTNDSNGESALTVNGEAAAGYDQSQGATSSFKTTMLLDEGDTVEAFKDFDYDVVLLGYDISGVIDNEVNTFQLGVGESVTVPSGEDWMIYCSSGSSNDSDEAWMEVDDTAALGTFDPDGSTLGTLQFNVQTVLPSGTKLTMRDDGELGAHIGYIVI